MEIKHTFFRFPSNISLHYAYLASALSMQKKTNLLVLDFGAFSEISNLRIRFLRFWKNKIDPVENKIDKISKNKIDPVENKIER